MQIFIKPSRPGLLVRDHADKFRPIPDEGKSVVRDSTWIKRIREGDVVLVDEAKLAPAPELEPAPELAPAPEAAPAREKLTVRKSETKKTEVKD